MATDRPWTATEIRKLKGFSQNNNEPERIARLLRRSVDSTTEMMAKHGLLRESSDA